MHKALQLLTAIETASPIADMGPDFKGNHGLTVHRDGSLTRLQLNVWRHGKSWPVYIGPEEFDNDTADMVRDILELIDKNQPRTN